MSDPRSMSVFAELQEEAARLSRKHGVTLIEWTWSVGAHNPAAPNGLMNWVCSAFGTPYRGYGHTGQEALSELVRKMREA